MSYENCLLERKFNFGQRWKIENLSHILPTNWIRKLLLTINRPRSYNLFFYDTSSFLKVSLIEKKLKIDPLDGFVLFLEGCFSLILINKLFTFSSNICVIKEWFTSTCFLKQSYSIGFVIRNQSFLHSSSWIFFNYWIFVIEYTMCYLCVYQINFCIVIYTIKNSNIKKFYHVVSKFSFGHEHAIFSSFLHYFFIAFFWIFICLCLNSWIYLIPIFENYIIHTYFNCFIIPTYHIFICRRLFHW